MNQGTWFEPEGHAEAVVAESWDDWSFEDATQPPVGWAAFIVSGRARRAARWDAWRRWAKENPKGEVLVILGFSVVCGIPCWAVRSRDSEIVFGTGFEYGMIAVFSWVCGIIVALGVMALYFVVPFLIQLLWLRVASPEVLGRTLYAALDRPDAGLAGNIADRLKELPFETAIGHLLPALGDQTKDEGAASYLAWSTASFIVRQGENGTAMLRSLLPRVPVAKHATYAQAFIQVALSDFRFCREPKMIAQAIGMLKVFPVESALPAAIPFLVSETASGNDRTTLADEVRRFVIGQQDVAVAPLAAAVFKGTGAVSEAALQVLATLDRAHRVAAAREALLEVARRHADGALRSRALEKLRDDASLVTVVREARNEDTWQAALERITDTRVLAQLADGLTDEARSDAVARRVEGLEKARAEPRSAPPTAPRRQCAEPRSVPPSARSAAVPNVSQAGSMLTLELKIQRAYFLGLAAGRRGDEARPVYDTEFCKLLGGESGLLTSADQPIINAWIEGYHDA